MDNSSLGMVLVVSGKISNINVAGLFESTFQLQKWLDLSYLIISFFFLQLLQLEDTGVHVQSEPELRGDL